MKNDKILNPKCKRHTGGVCGLRIENAVENVNDDKIQNHVSYKTYTSGA